MLTIVFWDSSIVPMPSDFFRNGRNVCRSLGWNYIRIKRA
jgi:hypothetical protein